MSCKVERACKEAPPMPRKQVKGGSVGVLMPVGLMRQPSAVSLCAKINNLSVSIIEPFQTAV